MYGRRSKLFEFAVQYAESKIHSKLSKYFSDSRLGKSRLKSTFPQTRVNKYHSTLEIGLTILSGINTGSVSNEFADK